MNTKLNELVEKTNTRQAETGYTIAACAITVARNLTNEQAAEILGETENRRYVKFAGYLLSPETDPDPKNRRDDVNNIIVSIITAEINGWNRE